MTKKEEIDSLYELGVKKSKGWQQSDNPVLSADYGDLEKAWNTLTTNWSEEERQETIKKIELAVHAQARFRRDSRQAGDFVPQPKLIASWLRKKRWLDQIESHAELNERKEVTVCKESGCTRPVHGPDFTQCTTHLPTTDDKINYQRNYMRRQGLTVQAGETMQQYVARCREHLRSINPEIARRVEA